MLYNDDGTVKAFNPARQLISFDPARPGAAISVGNLDAAKYATYQIPGLNNNVTESMNALMDTSRTRYEEQADIAGANPGVDASRIAVVGWLGAEPAVNAGVWSDAAAEKMGTALKTDVAGFQAVRNSLGSSALTTVVGHSYGSLAAMEGANRGLAADNLVLVGDIGAPKEVKSVGDLKLNEGGTVYRGSYNGDSIAWVGAGIGWQRPATTGAGFGAVTFGTDGEGSAYPTKTHEGITGGKDNIYGYFDRGTESGLNQARISLGLRDQLTNVKR